MNLKLAGCILTVLSAVLSTAQDKLFYLDFESESFQCDETKQFSLSVSGKPIPVDGVKGKALRFDGEKDSIIVWTYHDRRMQISPGRSMTIEFYFKPERKDSNEKDVVFPCRWGNIFFGGRSGLNTPFLWFEGNSKHIAEIWTGVEDYTADGQWHHIALVRDAQRKKIFYYVDGMLMKSLPETEELTECFSADKMFYIGAGGETWRGYFKGAIDEFTIWDGIKNSFDMEALRTGTKQPEVQIDPVLAGNWKEADAKGVRLIPCPKEIKFSGAAFPFHASGWSVIRQAPGTDEPGFEMFCRRLEEFAGGAVFSADSPRKITAGLWGSGIEKTLSEPVQVPIRQGYVLEVTPQKIILAGSDADGLRYGWLTLGNLLKENGEMQPAFIRDWPSFQYRSAYTYSYPFKEQTMKQMIDEAFLARVNIIMRTGITSIHENFPDSLKAVNEYAAARGILTGLTLVPSVETIDGYQQKIPAGYDGFYYPYKTEEGMHGWFQHAISWCRDDLAQKHAGEIADFAGKYSFTLIQLHPVDAGGIDNTANWGYRTEKDKAMWGDDFAAAQGHLIQVFASTITAKRPGTRICYVHYPYMPRLLVHKPEDTRKIHETAGKEVWLLRREGMRKDLETLEQITGPGVFYTSYYPFDYDLLPLFSIAGCYFATFYENENSMAEFEVWHPCGLTGDAYKFSAAEYMWNPFSPGARNLPENYSSFAGVRAENPEMEKILLPRICARLYGEKAGPVMAEFFAAKLSERYAEHPYKLIPCGVDQKAFFTEQVRLTESLIQKMKKIQPFVRNGMQEVFRNRLDYARVVHASSKVRLHCLASAEAQEAGDCDRAAAESEAGRQLLQNGILTVSNCRAWNDLLESLEDGDRLTAFAKRKEYADKLPEKKLKVAFYLFSGTGSDNGSAISENLLRSYDKTGGLLTMPVRDLTKENLKDADVLVFNATAKIGDNSEDWRKNLREFVEKDGKSVIFLHNAAGLSPVVFPEICSGASVRKSGVKQFNVTDGTMFEPFRKTGDSYIRGGHDHWTVKPGPRGREILNDGTDPVAVTGTAGKGKVLYSGEAFGTDADGRFQEPELDNWKMLFHFIRGEGLSGME